MIFIGIDPGVSGGIALLREDGSVVRAVAMPATEADLFQLLSDLDRFSGPNDSGPVKAVLERVSASPRMGVVSAFTFGKGYGALLMALTATRISFDLVSPSKWQPAMGVIYSGRAKQGQRDKNVSKRRAQQLFPSLTITHAIADACLLAEYSRRLESGRYVKEAIAEKDGEAKGADSKVHSANPSQALRRPAVAGAPRHGAGPKHPA